MELVSIGKFAKIQRAIRIRLLPTEEQEILFWKSAGTARWAYNYFLDANEQAYKEGSMQVPRPAAIAVISKKDLKLSERIYICPVCGAKLDRDLNAAINLANYKTA